MSNRQGRDQICMTDNPSVAGCGQWARGHESEGCL